jgi:hypothetical protein
MSSLLVPFKFEGRTYYRLNPEYYEILDGCMTPTPTSLQGFRDHYYFIGIDSKSRAIFIKKKT